VNVRCHFVQNGVDFASDMKLFGPVPAGSLHEFTNAIRNHIHADPFLTKFSLRGTMHFQSPCDRGLYRLSTDNDLQQAVAELRVGGGGLRPPQPPSAPWGATPPSAPLSTRLDIFVDVCMWN